MKIEQENSLLRCLKNGVSLFVGSGFSVLSSSSNGPLPVGDQLKNEILEIFPDAPKVLPLPQLCTLISRRNKEKLSTFLRNRFIVNEFDELYKNLYNVELKNVFTTNIDDLIQKIFRDSEDKYINDVNFNGTNKLDQSAVDLYHLHGSVLDPDSEFIFGDLEIVSAFQKEPSRWNFLRKTMGDYPIIFWGYALKDAGTLQTLSQALSENSLNQAWIIVHPDYIEDGEIEYYNSLGLKIIISDSREFLKYIGNIKPTNRITPKELKNPFPKYEIPSNSDVAYRALQEFYQGATPTWSDVYSSRVIRTSYYDAVEDALDGGKNILITGGAASGKSTLLLQVATRYKFDGLKLFIKDITKEKVKTMMKKLSLSPTLFFIDNCQSSLEALSLLSKNEFFSYVVAERDYTYLSSVYYEFFTKDIEIIDITNIKEQDAYNIYTNIPHDIKKTPYTQKEENDSIFEFIENNCKVPNIKDRFRDVIKHLKSTDIKLVELFLVACYMHRSRSVASMDILLAYFGDKISHYTEIYELAHKLGSSIREYTGDLVEENQDYFSIRSNMLADLIQDFAPPSNLRYMLTRFHNNVSRYSIPNYDTFKRSAYDARLFEKAFPQISQGIEIYDIIYRKHGSPFNLQQKALYLSRRKRYDLAFPVIDEAVAKAGSKNWSIKNSYAIIMFKANIDRNDSLEVRKALDDSMTILDECHNSDKRKTFHATTFADHSLSYWKKYRDEESYRYLVKSRDWLEDELETATKINYVRDLLKKCKNAIRSFE